MYSGEVVRRPRSKSPSSRKVFKYGRKTTGQRSKRNRAASLSVKPASIVKWNWMDMTEKNAKKNASKTQRDSKNTSLEHPANIQKKEDIFDKMMRNEYVVQVPPKESYSVEVRIRKIIEDKPKFVEYEAWELFDDD